MMSLFIIVDNSLVIYIKKLSNLMRWLKRQFNLVFIQIYLTIDFGDGVI